MHRLSSYVIRHRRLVGLVWLIAIVAGGYAAGALGNHVDKSYSIPGQPGYIANQAITGAYGTGSRVPPLVPVVRTAAGTPASAPAVQAAFGSLATLPNVRVADYANTHDARFIGSDGRTTFALVFTSSVGNDTDTTQTDLEPAITAALQRALPAGTEVRLTGETPLATGNSGSSGGVSIAGEVALGGVGALAVLLFVFASFLAFVPLMVAAVSVLTSYLVILGIALATDVSMIVQYIVGLIGLGVAIDYSLLLITRWREELARGEDNETAISNAMTTAGRAVAFSGLTVALGLISLVVLPVPFLRSVGYGGMVIPLVSVGVTLTLLPAMLAGVGRRADWPRIRHEGSASRGWTRWARFVIRRRWIAAGAALAVLIALAVTAFGLKLGDPSSDSLAQSGTAHEGIVMLRQADIPTGVITPIEVMVPEGSASTAAAAVARVSGVESVARPAGAEWHRAGTALVEAIPVEEGTSKTGENTTSAVRGALASAVPAAMVGGLSVTELDMIHAVYGNFALMLGILTLLTYVLLARAFRSLLLPLKAVVLNLLSVGAVYGGMLLVWQKGYGSHAIWGIPASGAIPGWIPLMVFAFLYGLSMDYEVFILSRIREEYDRTGSTGTAIVTGIGRTGRLVTSAALILFLAMAALASAQETEIKMFATALGTGILLDATVVRALLVPALVSLFGRWNWWMPVWAARILRVEPSPAVRETPAAAREQITSGV